MRKTLALVLAILMGFSILGHCYFSKRMDIDKIILMGQGAFLLVDQSREFEAGRLRDTSYNLVLRFLTEQEGDRRALNDFMYSPGAFEVKVELVDRKGESREVATVNEGAKLASMSSRDSIDWYLAKMPASSLQSSRLRVSVRSSEPLLDRMTKEVFLLQDYDYASLPWWKLLQRAFLFSTVSVASLLAVVAFWPVLRKHPLRKRTSD